MKDLSIIIISYNTKYLLRRCLTSIESSLGSSSSLSWEAIVVDNNSHDGTVQMIKREFPFVGMIVNKENVGYGRANNQAAEVAKGKYVLFLNSDTRVLNSGIEKLLDFAKEGGDSIFGGKLFNPDGSSQPSCGYFYSLPIVFLSLFLKGDQLHITRFSPKNFTKTDWVSGACLLIKKDVFRRLGGFDEQIFMYMDEVDLCYRAKKISLGVFFYPHAHFIHVGSASSADRRIPYVNLFSGLLYFYQKHWPDKLTRLKILLKNKAIAGLCLGKILGNKSLAGNYSKALELLKS